MKTVIITGSGSGMGKTTAKLLADKGYKVFALDIIEQKEEKNIIPIKVDVTDTSSIMKAYENIKLKTNSLDSIIHFAGIYKMDSLVEIEEKDFIKIFDINVFGVYRLNKIFLPLLIKNKGRIIIVSSELAGLNPLPFTGLYAITKSTIEKYAFSLFMELNLLDIKISVIRPGAVKTNMISESTNALNNMCNKTKLYKYNTSKFRQIVNNVQSKTIQPEKISKLVEKVLTKKNPKFIYSINSNKYLKLLSALPKKLQLGIIKKILKK